MVNDNSEELFRQPSVELLGSPNANTSYGPLWAIMMNRPYNEEDDMVPQHQVVSTANSAGNLGDVDRLDDIKLAVLPFQFNLEKLSQAEVDMLHLYHFSSRGMKNSLRDISIVGFAGISPYSHIIDPITLETELLCSKRPTTQMLSLPTRVHIHLLGMRGLTYLASGVWYMPVQAPQKCDRDSFTLELSSPDSNHNRHAGTFFAANFEDALDAGYYGKKRFPTRYKTQRAAILGAYRDVLRLQIQAQLEAQASRNAKDTKDAENRRDARRIAKWLRLLDVSQSLGAGPLSQALTRMGADGCSSDESDEEGTSSVCRIKPWRSQELDRFINACKVSGHYLHLKPSTSGRALESNRVLPLDLPSKFVDDQWRTHTMMLAQEFKIAGMLQSPV